MTRKLNDMSTIFCFFILVFTMSGCDKSTTDNNDSNLKTFIATLRHEKVNRQPDIKPTLLTPPPVTTYKGTKLREPFTSSGVKTDEMKSSNTLSAFPLSKLQFVGTITRNKSIYAYIVAPDKIVYQVGVGDEIGDQHGKVVQIYSDRIDVVEQELDGDKPPLKRLITLLLRKES